MNTCIDKFANDNESIKKSAEDLFLKMASSKDVSSKDKKCFGRQRRLLAST